MKKGVLILSSVAVTAVLALVAGCDTHGSDSDDSNRLSAVEQSFLTTVDDMRSAVTQYSNSSDKAGMRNDYRQRMDLDLGKLASAWNQMRSSCDQHAGDCETGGGVTGTWSDQCRSGGHMMGQGDMGRLQGYLNSCRSYLDEFWAVCGAQWSASCQQMADQHTQKMSGVLSPMWDDCNGWWSDGDMMGDDMMDGDQRGHC